MAEDLDLRLIVRLGANYEEENQAQLPAVYPERPLGSQAIHRFRMRRLYAIQDALAAPVKLMRRVKSALR